MELSAIPISSKYAVFLIGLSGVSTHEVAHLANSVAVLSLIHLQTYALGKGSVEYTSLESRVLNIDE